MAAVDTVDIVTMPCIPHKELYHDKELLWHGLNPRTRMINIQTVHCSEQIIKAPSAQRVLIATGIPPVVLHRTIEEICDRTLILGRIGHSQLPLSASPCQVTERSQSWHAEPVKECRHFTMAYYPEDCTSLGINRGILTFVEVVSDLEKHWSRHSKTLENTNTRVRRLRNFQNWHLLSQSTTMATAKKTSTNKESNYETDERVVSPPLLLVCMHSKKGHQSLC